MGIQTQCCGVQPEEQEWVDVKKHYDSGNHKSVNPPFTQGRDVSWFNQDRVKFPQQRGGALAGLFRYHADITSWQVTFSWRRARGALVVHSWFCTSCFKVLYLVAILLCSLLSLLLLLLLLLLVVLLLHCCIKPFLISVLGLCISLPFVGEGQRPRGLRPRQGLNHHRLLVSLLIFSSHWCA